MGEYLNKFKEAYNDIILFRGLKRDPLIVIMIDLMNSGDLQYEEWKKKYNEFLAAFIPWAEIFSNQGKDAWPNYVLNLMLADENIFSLQAEKLCFEKIPAATKTLAVSDLQNIQILASFSPQMCQEIFKQKVRKIQNSIEILLDWNEVHSPFIDIVAEKKRKLFSAFCEMSDWSKGITVLSEYFHRNGTGLFGEYNTLRWVNDNGQRYLAGVDNPDPISFKQLYEYEWEQERIINNTEQFLAGYRGNNVLLYGDRGTGKSSTIKALINKYGDMGLRLIEIQKQDLDDFPQIISALARRPQRFILFIDDLSFGENETEYRQMKALLEGGVETKPQNVLIYATSNRRHLVYERANDREQSFTGNSDEDMRSMYTLQEKLSLADRFGIAVTFIAPDQKKYLGIVEKLARERGLNIEKDQLTKLALKWELSFNARSARTARQFIDHLEGRIAMDKKG